MEASSGKSKLFLGLSTSLSLDALAHERGAAAKTALEHHSEDAVGQEYGFPWLASSAPFTITISPTLEAAPSFPLTTQPFHRANTSEQ